MNTTHSALAQRITAGAIALSLCTGFFPATAAFAQERHERREREAVRPYHTPHLVFDNRYHHAHYYPAIGYSVTALPSGYLNLSFGKRRFIFHGGVWFQPVGARFVVVRPPVGIVVPVLPPAYTTVWLAGVPYY